MPHRSEDTPSPGRARTFYCPALAKAPHPSPELPLEVELPAEEAHHAAQVLRMRPGDRIRAFDGQGFFYDGTILEVARRNARARFAVRRPSQADPRSQITLLVATTKGRKPDLIIQKAVELGVARIALFPAQRSVTRTDDAPPEGEPRDRYDKIVVAASKQCGRARLMEVRLYPNLEAALASIEPRGARIAFWEQADARANALPTRLALGEPAAALIGPEGGLAAEEVELAGKAGFAPASLGPRILRAETAAIAAATLLLAAAGELGSAESAHDLPTTGP